MLAFTAPVKLHFHPAEFIGEDFSARWADDDGGLRAGDGWARGSDLRAEDDLFAHAGEGVVAAGRLQPTYPAAFFNQVAPRIVGIFLIPPLLDPVVFDVIKLTGIEVQAIRRRVVSELLTVHQLAGITAVQLTVGLILVLDLAAQFVEGANEFAGRIVLVTTVNRVVGVFYQQLRLNAGIENL